MEIFIVMLMLVLADTYGSQMSRLFFDANAPKIKFWTIVDLLREIKPRPALLGVAHGLVIILAILAARQKMFQPFFIVLLAMLLPPFFIGVGKHMYRTYFYTGRQAVSYLVPYNLLLGITLFTAGDFIQYDPFAIGVSWVVTVAFGSFAIYMLASFKAFETEP